MIKTLPELASALNTLYPTAYSHFASNQPTPFIVYLDDGSEHLAGDNIIIQESYAVRIEIYTDFKDLEVERKIKELLTNNEIPYSQDATFFIEEENLFLSIFNITITN